MYFSNEIELMKLKFKVNDITFDNLMKPFDENTIISLRKTLTHQGIVSISKIPGLDQLRKDVFKYQSICAFDKNSNSMSSTLGDGTIRKSFVAQNSRGILENFTNLYSSNSSINSSFACENFVNKANEMRELVQRTSLAFISKLDDVCGTSLLHHQSILVESKLNNHDGYTSVSSFVSEGNSLEHFHSYKYISTKNKSDYNNFSEKMEIQKDTIELHTDNGLFIGFIPGLFINENSYPDEFYHNNDDDDDSTSTQHQHVDTTGFFIQLSNGTIVEPVFHR